MESQEHREIIEHVGHLLNQYGLGSLHGDGLSAGRGADFSDEYCARYLEAFAGQLEALSSRTYQATLAIAREHILTEDGWPIEDVVVSLSEAERQMNERPYVSLREAADLTAVVITLRDVASYIRADGEGLR